MSTLSYVTEELDRRRTDKPLTDEDCWDLCRIALRAKGSMPKDEIVRRVAGLVDEVIALRVTNI